MKLNFTKYRFLVLFALFSQPLFAQENLAISDADISRMGIVFAPAQVMDNDAGASFPATVINSPDSIATLSARFPGVIEQWQQNSGSLVSAGEVLASSPV